MRMRSSSKSGLFLMELIIAIAFFAVASAICIQLFAKAHTISAKSSNTNMAVTVAQNAAEAFKQYAGDPAQTAGLLGGTMAGNRITAYYDQDWNPASETGRFLLTVELDDAQAVASAHITVADTHNDDLLHSITSKKYAGQ